MTVYSNDDVITSSIHSVVQARARSSLALTTLTQILCLFKKTILYAFMLTFIYCKLFNFRLSEMMSRPWTNEASNFLVVLMSLI